MLNKSRKVQVIQLLISTKVIADAPLKDEQTLEMKMGSEFFPALKVKSLHWLWRQYSMSPHVPQN